MIRRTGLDNQFMDALRTSGLTDETIRALLLAPSHLKVFHLRATDLDVHVRRVQKMLEGADSVGAP